MEQLIDIVIPIYNREHCIVGLIAELEKQTFRSFRAIFVDDGSTDRSAELLEELLKDANFSYLVHRKENGGAASARNAGLRLATAPWIAFMDSDDGLHPDYLNYLYRAVDGTAADLAVCYFQMIHGGDLSKAQPVGEFSSRMITPAECMKLNYTDWFGVYCLLIKGSLQREHQLFFDEACTYCEDIPFITEVIEASTQVVEVCNALYLYRAVEGTLSRSPKLGKFLIGVEGFRRTEDKMHGKESEAARMFCHMGGARYYLATFRKAAVQLSYQDFVKLMKQVPFAPYKDQIVHMNTKQRAAANLLLASGRVFYHAIRLLFND